MIEAAEYANLAQVEEDLWWFRGMRRIVDGILTGAVDGCRIRRVLDAGCGTGYYAGYLEQSLGWRVYPTDLNAEGIRFARAAARCRFTQADIAALPYRDACFDVVVCMDVLPHFAPGAETPALRELFRVTAPSGVLILRTAACPYLASRHSQYYGEQQRFKRRRLVHAVERAGFRVLRCTYANSLLSPVALLKFRLWEPLLRKKPTSGLQPLPRWLNSFLYACLRVEDRWIRNGKSFPVGQSLILAARRTPQ